MQTLAVLRNALTYQNRPAGPTDMEDAQAREPDTPFGKARTNCQ